MIWINSYDVHFRINIYVRVVWKLLCHKNKYLISENIPEIPINFDFKFCFWSIHFPQWTKGWNLLPKKSAFCMVNHNVTVNLPDVSRLFKRHVPFFSNLTPYYPLGRLRCLSFLPVNCYCSIAPSYKGDVIQW